MSNIVQYYVMKRPKHPLTGEVVRGKSSGATKNADGSINEGGTMWFPDALQTPGPNGSLMDTTKPLTRVVNGTDIGKVDGEPWILHSVHFSIKDAIDSAMKVTLEVGSENTRILKSIAHELDLKLV